MNGTPAAAASLCAEIRAGIDHASNPSDVVLCPPYLFITTATGAVAGSKIEVGAQDLDINQDGAFTGQISANMLVSSGCRYVIVGHSERRACYHDSDELVAQKTVTALAAKLCPIVCLGETLAQRESGAAEEVVGQQLDAVLKATAAHDFTEAVIAYEPVWAIGTGQTATPTQAQQIHAFIRARLAAHDTALAEQCRILYGGSMKPENAAQLLAEEDIDGGLIGGAALVADDFLAICQAAA